jgi:NTP pyrophosphatase (non-canonical NTP hydrolase)
MESIKKMTKLDMKVDIGLPIKFNGLLSFDFTIMEDLSAELSRARAKFPSGYNILAALFEEGGELASALMQNKSKQEIRKEALQVMAMCVRIIEEGDRSIHIDEETSQK